MASETPVVLVLDSGSDSYMALSKVFGQRVELARCDDSAEALASADGRVPFLTLADGDNARPRRSRPSWVARSWS